MADKNYTNFLESLRQIQGSVIAMNALNEADEDKESDPTEDDLNSLLNSDKSGEEPSGLDDLNLDDDNKEEGKEEPKEDEEKEEKPEENKEDEESEEDNKPLETDSDNLMDTINKLLKAGHDVKIVISAEGKEYFFNNNACRDAASIKGNGRVE